MHNIMSNNIDFWTKWGSCQSYDMYRVCPYISDVHIEGYTVNALVLQSIEQDESQLATSATDTKQLLSS